MKAGKTFTLFSLLKWTAPDQKTLVVYIEGDGKAWISRYKQSRNPTPVNPIAMRLAVKDSYPNVLYLARPCQYVAAEQVPQCQPQYWSSHRYSQLIIDDYHQILDQIRREYSIQRFELIGFSGGGMIAALLAAQRNDVSDLVTVSANLDHTRWTQHHRITPLYGSVDLSLHVEALREIPQGHLWGNKDRIVPYQVNLALLERILSAKKGYYKIYEAFDHFCCWSEQWPEIIRAHRLKIQQNSY
jgi:pimeloyl-ACP methyl ester carboxylesterase